ncbi:hypothetical protein [Streptomyces prasinus]|nr:hypothetical protein [Streptomyces prasinus]
MESTIGLFKTELIKTRGHPTLSDKSLGRREARPPSPSNAALLERAR